MIWTLSGLDHKGVVKFDETIYQKEPRAAAPACRSCFVAESKRDECLKPGVRLDDMKQASPAVSC